MTWAITLPAVKLSVLGPVSVVSGAAHDPVRGTTQPAVLAVLVSQGGRNTARDFLVEHIWDGQATARTTLRVTLNRLREKLVEMGLGDVIDGGDGWVSLDLGSGDVDAWVFEDRIARARNERIRGRHRAAVEHFERAFELWRGRPYEGLEEYGLLAEESERLTRLGRSAELELIATLLDSGDPAAAAERALHPRMPFADDIVADEQRICLAGIALVRSGRRASAVELFERFTRSLLDEWGLSPSEGLVELANALPAGGPDAEFGEAVLGRFAPLDPAAMGRIRSRQARVEHGAGAGPGASLLRRAHTEPPLAGRLDEVELLHALVDGTADGRSLVLQGVDGSGRSRLLAEAVGVAQTVGSPVAGVALSDGRLSLVEALAVELGALGVAVDLAPVESRLDAEGDVSAAAELHAANVGILRSALRAMPGPLTVVIDDLDLADGPAVEALLALTAGCPEVRWALACSDEPEGDAGRLVAELQRTGHAAVRLLDGLDVSAIEEILSSVAPDHASTALAEQIHDSSRGLAAHVVEQARYVASVGVWDDDSTAVAALIGRRIDSLAAPRRALLRAFAAGEGSCRVAVAALGVAALVGDAPPVDELAVAADELVEGRLLADGDGPGEFRVAGSVVAELALGGLRRHDEARLRLALAEGHGRFGQRNEQALQLVAVGPAWWPDGLDVDEVVADALAGLVQRSLYRPAGRLAEAYADATEQSRPGLNALRARVLAATAMVAAGLPGGRALAGIVRTQARELGEPGVIVDAAAAAASVTSGAALPAQELEELIGLIPLLVDDPVRQATVGCWAAHQLSLVGRDGQAVELARAAADAATRAGSERLHGLAIGIRYHAHTGVDGVPAAADDALAELTSLAALTDDGSTHSIWALSSLSAALRDGDRTDVEEALGRLDAAIERSPRPDLPWIKATSQVVTALSVGDVAAAREAAGVAEQVGRAHGMVIASAISHLHGALIGWETGTLGLLRDFLPSSVSAHRDGLVGAALRIAAEVESGNDEAAAELLGELAGVEQPLTVAAQLWPVVASLVGESAFEVRHAGAAGLLRATLAGYRGRGVGMYVFSAFGSADRLLGMAAATLGDLDSAVALLEASVADEERRGLVSWSGRSAVALASVLTRRAGPGDEDRAGELWMRDPVTPGVAGFRDRERRRLSI